VPFENASDPFVFDASSIRYGTHIRQKNSCLCVIEQKKEGLRARDADPAPHKPEMMDLGPNPAVQNALVARPILNLLTV
jgi:hypothetical protein